MDDVVKNLGKMHAVGAKFNCPFLTSVLDTL